MNELLENPLLAPSASEAAQQNLTSALARLTTSATAALDDVVGSAGHSVSDAMAVMSDSVVGGIQHIKSEVDIKSYANENPWGLVIGSFIGGALFEYTTRRLLIRHTDSSRSDVLLPNFSVVTTGVVAPLTFALSQWGIKRYLAPRLV